MEISQLKIILQAALMSAGRNLALDDFQLLFDENDEVDAAAIRQALSELKQDAENTCFSLKELASGYSYQIKSDYAPWLAKLWADRPSRYSRAFLETLVIIAYRQPVTRGEIEDIRGVAVSQNIMKTLLEREWIRVIGHRDVLGKPAIYGTTKNFLDYFNLKSLDELPTLDEIKNLDELSKQLEMPLTLESEITSNEQFVLAEEFVTVDQPAFETTVHIMQSENDLEVAD